MHHRLFVGLTISDLGYFYLSFSWDLMVRSFWWVAVVESECVCSVGGCKKPRTMLPTAKNLPKKTCFPKGHQNWLVVDLPL